MAVEGTPVLARAARDAGLARLVHVSTAGVYDRSAGVGDVAEDGVLQDHRVTDRNVGPPSPTAWT